MFPSARRRLRFVCAAAPRRALLFHGAWGRGLLRGPRPGPRVNPRTRDQEPSWACTRARARDGPHDDGAAANPFPTLGLLGDARPGRPKTESTKGKEINSRGGGWRRIFEEGTGRSLYGSARHLERFRIIVCFSRVHFRARPRDVPSGSNVGYIGVLRAPSPAWSG